jgi:nitrate reductase beta subunit
MFQLEQMTLHYLPRICNHCLNPACVGSCPSGALYKRGEDGIVLINQDKCRAWRMCVTACPYKKSYYNWNTGKSEKCILCYPRLESGQAPACMHSCVGRIRYLGVMLYDADKIKTVAAANEEQLLDAQLNIYLDPNDPEVIKAARENGVHDSTITAAQNSPVYKFVKRMENCIATSP